VKAGNVASSSSSSSALSSVEKKRKQKDKGKSGQKKGRKKRSRKYQEGENEYENDYEKRVGEDGLEESSDDDQQQVPSVHEDHKTNTESHHTSLKVFPEFATHRHSTQGIKKCQYVDEESKEEGSKKHDEVEDEQANDSDISALNDGPIEESDWTPEKKSEHSSGRGLPGAEGGETTRPRLPTNGVLAAELQAVKKALQFSEKKPKNKKKDKKKKKKKKKIGVTRAVKVAKPLEVTVPNPPTVPKSPIVAKLLKVRKTSTFTIDNSRWTGKKVVVK
jgi:hypothetical protein